MISAGEVITIRRSEVDADHNGNIDDQEWAAVESRLGADVTGVSIDGGTPINLGAGTLDALKQQVKNALMADNAQNTIPSDQAGEQLPNALLTLHALVEAAQSAKTTLDQLRSQGASQEQIDQARTALEQAKSRLASHIRTVEHLNRSANNAYNEGIDIPTYNLAGISPDGETGSKATITYGGGAGAGTGSGVGAQTTGGMPTSGFMPPATWGTNPLGGMKGFSTDAYMQSVMMEDSILSSFDSVLKNENKGRQLMMLFFYFARMAESGDLGAMYQFMKFLTYIISKDKSKQQIDMGKKLIELQDLSRQWTDKLLGMQTDSTDPNASTEFTKMMTQVKSETDAIATSQKLISQMMEEFAQIVETLTNATKGALEAEGRVLRTVSRFNG